MKFTLAIYHIGILCFNRCDASGQFFSLSLLPFFEYITKISTVAAHIFYLFYFISLLFQINCNDWTQFRVVVINSNAVMVPVYIFRLLAMVNRTVLIFPMKIQKNAVKKVCVVSKPKSTTNVFFSSCRFGLISFFSLRRNACMWMERSSLFHPSGYLC